MITSDLFAIFFIFFNLNSSMVNSIFLLADFIDFLNHLISEFWSYMARHNKLASCQAPAMEVMNFVNTFQVLDFIVQLDCIYFLWGCLHNDVNTFNEDRDCGHKYKHWKCKCANWIGDLPVWSAFNNDCGRYHSNTLDQIPQQMDYCCLYI